MSNDKFQKLNHSNNILLGRILGSSLSGVLELIMFHPIDTVTKRLMTNTTTIHQNGNSLKINQALVKVIFREAHNERILIKYTSLFPGLTFAAGDKILCRICRFGGHPIIRDYLNSNYSDSFFKNFGEKNGKVLLHGVAGSIVGVSEIILLPLDVLKIRAQTNPGAINGKNIFHIVKTEGLALYRGGGWTAMRNIPGSFALFGGSAACKEYVFNLSDYNDAKFSQIFLSSIVGATASVIISQPLDVIKTRVQSVSFNSPQNGHTVMKKLIAMEGFNAFFKGIIPKLGVVGPKLVFSFSIAQYLISYIEKQIINNNL